MLWEPLDEAMGGLGLWRLRRSRWERRSRRRRTEQRQHNRQDPRSSDRRQRSLSLRTRFGTPDARRRDRAPRRNDGTNDGTRKRASTRHRERPWRRPLATELAQPTTTRRGGARRSRDAAFTSRGASRLPIAARQKPLRRQADHQRKVPLQRYQRRRRLEGQNRTPLHLPVPDSQGHPRVGRTGGA